MCTVQVLLCIYFTRGFRGLLDDRYTEKHGAFFLPTLSRLFLMNAGYDVSFQFTVVERTEKMLSLSHCYSEDSMLTGAFTCSPPLRGAHKRGYATDNPGAELKQIHLKNRRPKCSTQFIPSNFLSPTTVFSRSSGY